MEDLSQKLADILNDPESMEKVRNLASNILSGDNEEKPVQSQEGSMVSPNEMKAIMNIMGRLKNGNDDRRTALLLALKPNLSKEKQEKVDTAVKLLKLVELLPYLKESGILSIF